MSASLLRRGLELLEEPGRGKPPPPGLQRGRDGPGAAGAARRRKRASEPDRNRATVKGRVVKSAIGESRLGSGGREKRLRRPPQPSHRALLWCPAAALSVGCIYPFPSSWTPFWRPSLEHSQIYGCTLVPELWCCCFLPGSSCVSPCMLPGCTADVLCPTLL